MDFAKLWKTIAGVILLLAGIVEFSLGSVDLGTTLLTSGLILLGIAHQSNTQAPLQSK